MTTIAMHTTIQGTKKIMKLRRPQQELRIPVSEYKEVKINAPYSPR